MTTGDEEVGPDELMGQNEYRFDCRCFPNRLEGRVDKATFNGIGRLHAFRVSFQYDAIPVPKNSSALPPILTPLSSRQSARHLLSGDRT